MKRATFVGRVAPSENHCSITLAYFQKISSIPAKNWIYLLEFSNLKKKIIYCPQIEVYHKASPGGRPGWQRFYYYHRNRIWLSFKYLPLSYAFIHSAAWCAKIFVDSLENGYFTFFLKGFRDGIIELPALMRRERKVISRQTIQKLKSLSGRLYY